jgi:hypothetical protein
MPAGSAGSPHVWLITPHTTDGQGGGGAKAVKKGCAVDCSVVTAGIGSQNPWGATPVASKTRCFEEVGWSNRSVVVHLTAKQEKYRAMPTSIDMHSCCYTSQTIGTSCNDLAEIEVGNPQPQLWGQSAGRGRRLAGAS